MSRLETWDKLESAIGDARSMVSLLILAQDHDGPVDFAITDLEERMAVVSKIYNQLHEEVHHGPGRHRLRVVETLGSVEPPKPARVRYPGKSAAAKKGWEKRRRALAARAGRPMASEDSNVIPLR